MSSRQGVTLGGELVLTTSDYREAAGGASFCVLLIYPVHLTYTVSKVDGGT